MAVTILTGAGASRPLDYPTTTEFFPADGSAPHPEILKLLESQTGSPLDVENALAVLQPIIDFKKTPSGRFLHHKRPSGWWESIEAFTTYAKERCFDLYGAYPDLEAVSSLYGPLLDLLNPREQRVSLFTANYDPVTDAIVEMAHTRDLRCYDGFDGTGWWDPEPYGLARTGIDIYRLHGSMCWVMQGNRLKNTRDYSLRRSATQHLLIYPGYKGNPYEEQQEVYRFCHKAFADDLLTTNVLIAIGFSFRDEHINKAVAEAFRANRGLRIIVVNPAWPPGMQNIIGGSRTTVPDRVVAVKERFGDPQAHQGIASALRMNASSRRGKR